MISLKEKCNCIDAKDADVEELIHLISAYTCWANEPCETFLMGEREEVIDLPDCLDGCDIITFTPFYHPFVAESFSFKLVEQNGLTETVTDLVQGADYIYSEVDENFKIDPSLPGCSCRPECGCGSQYKLVVTYLAGYEDIPDCLIPVFCEALQWIAEKNECDCENCEQCDEEVREEVINATTLTGALKVYWLDVLSKQYARQLGLISLCNGNYGRIWGLVI